MAPGHHLNEPWSILRTSILHEFTWSHYNVPGSRWMPSTYGDGVYTIWKSLKIIITHVEFVSFDELEPRISWIQWGPGTPAGGRAVRFQLGALPLVEGEGCEALPSWHVGSPGITQHWCRKCREDNENHDFWKSSGSVQVHLETVCGIYDDSWTSRARSLIDFENIIFSWISMFSPKRGRVSMVPVGAQRRRIYQRKEHQKWWI